MRKCLVLALLLTSLVSYASDPPDCYAAPVGGGTNGVVHVLFTDAADAVLYVGGLFTTVDGSIAAANIASVTEAAGVYSWHAMGAGLPGKVHAIAEMNGVIYAGGDFGNSQNVMMWNGTTWQATGCINGVVKSLVVFNGELYAGGHFDICAALAEVNFAKWNGTGWQQFPALTGTVNTMEVLDTSLLLGGSFVYNNNTVNVIGWSANAGFESYASSVPNVVNDFVRFGGGTYAGCTGSALLPDNVLYSLAGNNWTVQDSAFASLVLGSNNLKSANTFCQQADTLYGGGDFFSNMIVGTYFQNLIVFPLPGNILAETYFTTDSTIHTMAVFRNQFFAGGAFQYGSRPATVEDQYLGGIARKVYTFETGMDEVPAGLFRFFPNPASPSSKIFFTKEFAATKCRLITMNGVVVAEADVRANSFEIPELQAGLYLLQTQNSKGETCLRKLAVAAR